MKLLSICVPCYNSEAYMEKCVDSLLAGGEDVEIVIVDDGSRDGTAAIADRYAQQYPDVIRVVHKENGGHGSAVNSGIDAAVGTYFKVVDSDDFLEEDAFKKVLEKLRELDSDSNGPDMMLCNYVYNKEGEHRHKSINYRGIMPENRLFTWDEAGICRKGHYILMHAIIYRTSILRDMGFRLPEHCFYVDNIYAFNPFPHVKTLYYMDVDLYYYYIGREDQSVNERVMISRLDQQMRVNRIMADYYSDHYDMIIENPKVSKYMFSYLEIITTISSIMAYVSNTPEHIRMKEELWSYLRTKDTRLYRRLHRGILGRFLNLPGEGSRRLCVMIYRIARRMFNFN